MEKKQAELIRKEVEKHKEEFCLAIEKVVPKLKKEIEKKNTILMPVKDLEKEMGPKFETSNPTRFYWAAKFCLWDNGINVEPKKKNNEPSLLMRSRTPDDKLFKTDEKVARDIMTVMVFGNPPKARRN